MDVVGSNIKNLRLGKKYSVRDLAERVGASASFISQVENGKISPSLSKLKEIADALNTTVGQLVGETVGSASPVVRFDERKKAENLEQGMNIYLLSSNDQYKQMEPLLLKMEVNAASGDKQYRHYGQEFILVLKGKVEMLLNQTKYILNKGDSMYFNSSIPHSFKNISKDTTEVLWVITPPSF